MRGRAASLANFLERMQKSGEVSLLFCYTGGVTDVLKSLIIYEIV